MPEIVVLNPGGEDQEVIRELILAQVNQPLSRVDGGDFILQHLHVALPAHDRAQGGGNLIRGQQAGSDLIEHGTKQVVVPLVDQHDVHGSSRERLRCK